MIKNYPRTIFVDLDGCIIKGAAPRAWQLPFELLPGVHETFMRWWEAGSHIVIVTGRLECARAWTEGELARLGIFYHQLVMGVGSGTRYLVNDTKPYDPVRPTAVAVNLLRDDGLANIEEFED